MNEDEDLPGRTLKEACVHTAGHAMVSRRLGYHSSWWVWGEAGKLCGRNELIGTPSPEHTRLIALAGPAAEAIAAERGLEADALHAGLNRLMTPRDNSAAPEFTLAEVSACLDLLRPMLTDILAEAREQPDVATQVKRHKSRSYYR
ncbi:MAG: hypothetical protein AAGE43_06580 [Pseudomonadota bacterium]